MSSNCSASESTGWSSPRGASINARRSSRPWADCRSSTCSHASSIPTPSACCPTTRVARGSPSSTSPGSGADASPRSPGPSGSRPSACAPRLPGGDGRSRPCRATGALRAAGRKPGAARPSQTLFAQRKDAPDALFCGNDQIARGAIEALREMGLAVPADVAVVGFDNWDVMTEATRPQLTSIDMNLDALGREAGRRAHRNDRRRQAHRRAAPAVLARRARLVRRRSRRSNQEAVMRKGAYSPVPFAEVRDSRPVLARAARSRARAHHPEPARQARRGRHSRLVEAAQARPAADHPTQRPQLHHAGVLGLGRRQMDRGGELRAVAPARRRDRSQDRRHRRRSRQGAIARRLFELLVQRPRARQALDQPARQPRTLQRRAPAGRRDRLFPRDRSAAAARRHGALRRSYRRDVRRRDRARSAAIPAIRRSSSRWSSSIA